MKDRRGWDSYNVMTALFPIVPVVLTLGPLVLLMLGYGNIILCVGMSLIAFKILHFVSFILKPLEDLHRYGRE